MKIGLDARTWGAVAFAGAVIVLIAIFASRRGRAPTEPPTTFSPASGVAPLPPWRPHRDAGPTPADKLPKSALVPDAGRPQVFDVGFHPGDGPLVRPMDKEIFAFIAAGIAPAGQSKDIFPKQPYRVDVFREGPDGLFTKVMIDVNRNGKWEEMWLLTDQEVFRKESVDDNGSYRDFTTLRMGRWKSPD